MSSRAVLAVLLAAFLSGCGKSPKTSPPPTASSVDPGHGKTGDIAAGEAATAAALSAASEAALRGALAELTQALRKYSFEHRGLPKTIGDMVAAGYLKVMPQAPPGKTFAIDAKSVQVVLVNQ